MAKRPRVITDADRKAAAVVRDLWATYKKAHPGVSQETAAERAGFTQSAFSQFLLGSVPMRITPVIKLAKLFGVAPTDIRPDIADVPYASAGPAKVVTAEEPGRPSREALEIAHIFDRLEPQTQTLIREQIYIYSVIDRSYPWLRRGRPKGESYDSFEKRHQQNMAAMLALEARRQHKAKS